MPINQSNSLLNKKGKWQEINHFVHVCTMSQKEKKIFWAKKKQLEKKAKKKQLEKKAKKSETKPQKKQKDQSGKASKDGMPKTKKKQHMPIWYFDSGCSRHMTGDKKLLSSFKEKSGGAVTFGDNKQGQIRVYGELTRDIGSENLCLVSLNNEDVWLWDKKFSHLNFSSLDKLVKLNLVKGLPSLKFNKDHICSTCEMGKLKRSSHKTKSDNNCPRPLHMLHVDLYGPISVQSLSVKKYILVLIDEYSRYTWIEFIRVKSDVPNILISLLRRLQKKA
ncbi:hypothetical protein L6452_05859 [Arctium lappa]|uniref:Uncharacterized protein n=1 Tax=Arctium lappa TaxID=4217 RepID=A0ACB9EI10_ARCLA|nr:hypothetical protein L6452_05859 [Arctium lappa]